MIIILFAKLIPIVFQVLDNIRHICARGVADKCTITTATVLNDSLQQSEWAQELRQATHLLQFANESSEFVLQFFNELNGECFVVLMALIC